MVLLMFVKFKELRTPTNFIIINLAFTDIGVAGVGYPMSAASDIHGSWKFGYAGCQVCRIRLPLIPLHAHLVLSFYAVCCLGSVQPTAAIEKSSTC